MDLIPIIEYVVSAILAIVSYFVVRYLNKSNTVKSLSEIKISDDVKTNLANNVVLAIQELYENYRGRQKYELAVENLSNMLKERGITVTDDELKMLIESSLREAKLKFQDEWEKQSG